MRGQLILFVLVSYAAAVVCDPEYPYRSFDGSCNNLETPLMGATGEFFRRGVEGAEFADGISEPVDRGNARTISNLLAAAGPSGAPKNTNGVSMLESIFAQFLNHDLENNLLTESTEVFYTLLDPTDTLYKINATNNHIITSFSLGAVSSETQQFEVYNNATAWLDLSNVYGSDSDTAAALRLGTDGKLKTSTYSAFGAMGPMVFTDLPASQALTGLAINTPLVGAPSTIPTFGDFRGNENLALFLVNSLFVREHNRLARVLAASHPSWSDEELFQEARKRNIAVYQHLVFDDYLPLVLGVDVSSRLGPYDSYDSSINGQTSLTFSVGAFRYGHFTIGQWQLKNSNNCPYTYTIPAGVLGPFPIVSTELPNAGQLGGTFSPAVALALSGGIGNALNGLLTSTAEAADVLMSEALRTIRFGGSIGAGIDIFVFDLLRGRFNGLPDYLTLRERYYPGQRGRIYQLPECHANRRQPAVDPLECFLVITSNTARAEALRNLYGKIGDIDAVAGLMSEDHREGDFLPPTVIAIIKREYEHKRSGDRFWYENGQFDEATLLEIKSRHFSDLLRDNFGLTKLPDNAFITPRDFVDYPICPV